MQGSYSSCHMELQICASSTAQRDTETHHPTLVMELNADAFHYEIKPIFKCGYSAQACFQWASSGNSSLLATDMLEYASEVWGLYKKDLKKVRLLD